MRTTPETWLMTMHKPTLKQNVKTNVQGFLAASFGIQGKDFVGFVQTKARENSPTLVITTDRKIVSSFRAVNEEMIEQTNDIK